MAIHILTTTLYGWRTSIQGCYGVVRSKSGSGIRVECQEYGPHKHAFNSRNKSLLRSCSPARTAYAKSPPTTTRCATSCLLSGSAPLPPDERVAARMTPPARACMH